jgi:light-regulated signal transduction histidine kinase (bacteriophytochrome)
MQDRLTRFVTERTHMLAALSHDLRSPLTAMRLRIEMLDETEDSVRLKTLVEEMQAMVEATLEFARGVAKTEPAAIVDLAAMLGELVRDVGGDRASLAPSLPVHTMVRPHALNRALRNLIDNAVRYGGVAEVSLMQEPGITVIMVSDKGPGLPKDQLEAVFEPFVRLEGSRNRDTGGGWSWSGHRQNYHSGSWRHYPTGQPDLRRAKRCRSIADRPSLMKAPQNNPLLPTCGAGTKAPAGGVGSTASRVQCPFRLAAVATLMRCKSICE